MPPPDAAERAMTLSEMVKPFFANEHPFICSTALAELMAIWLCAHVAQPRNADEERALRDELFKDWSDTVWKLVAHRTGETVQ